MFSRRAVLNIAMLLRDSEVARQIRVYLLDMEYLARTQPVENSVHSKAVSLDDRIDQRITHILGKTVVPMHHERLKRLEGVRDDRPAIGVMAAMDAMHGRTFEQHVAKLLIGSAKVLYSADVALFVATCPFTPDALRLAAETGITAVHRGVLEEWAAGEPLKILE
ncbi:hypothetical protein ABZ848_48785 [Streptomyces sp. NPDC047081]|uniref:hypothetical protein n=1 Tax=Streptomyces sp. NPDC047081 TaxID=3154706 RepID=UPI0033C6CC25